MSRPRLLRTEGIVIKRTDFGEADRILTLYTPYYGKLRAVAKGVRRVTSKLGGHLEMCIHANLLLARGRDLHIVTQAESVESFVRLRGDMHCAASASYVADMADRLTPDHLENTPVFELLLQTMRRLDTVRNPAVTVHMYELQLLGLLGYRPELRCCVQCHADLAETVNYFSSSAGGVLCGGCARQVGQSASRPLSARAFKVLRLLQSDDYATASRLRLDLPLRSELEAVLYSYLSFVMEGEPRSALVLRSIMANR